MLCVLFERVLDTLERCAQQTAGSLRTHTSLAIAAAAVAVAVVAARVTLEARCATS